MLVLTEFAYRYRTLDTARKPELDAAVAESVSGSDINDLADILWVLETPPAGALADAPIPASPWGIRKLTKDLQATLAAFPGEE